MNGESRYAVMRRSKTNVYQVDVVAGAARTVARQANNRVALLMFSAPTAASARISVRPLVAATVLGNFMLGRTLTDAATTQSFQYNLLALNVFDHGDAVNQEWFADAVTADAVVTVIEVLDPELRIH